ncbi:PP2C family protein-serine/threonine phosphatase [Biformimicrobium ophioploci]|uniref:SpoIIE family protein phosphatase n=1 Tax=Biformimicrobium ophioploci TaxID=3036711 RepID=A0ABQ6LYY3_9GAMM|nr:SpoIIE family protein phosphatase [Microbulbifer sp. NKW57]GMG87298.1 SpoIIE family protein phosphatase [Microbulbifer sp. NKW57]
MDTQPGVLLIKSESESSAGLGHFLSGRGYLVEEHASAVEALTRFRSEYHQLVITDLRLPDISGLDVLRRIKSDSPETPVMVLGGHADLGDVVRALREGASDYLLHPLSDHEIVNLAVKRLMQARKLLTQNRVIREELERRNRELKEHLQVLQQDQQAGRLLQQHMLPRTPYRYPGGIEASFRLLPTLYLSGDFVDYGLFGERFVAFYLADVSGHGVSSALVTALIKHSTTHLVREKALFASLTELENDLQYLIEFLNRELFEAPLDKHASLFIGVVDTRAQELYYCVGGQLPMPALIDRGKASWLPGKGKPVGLFADGSWEVFRCKLPQHWNLVACSDGVLELLSGDSLMEKEAQLLDLIEESEGSIDTLCRLLKIDRPEEQPDDIAVLRLRHVKS